MNRAPDSHRIESTGDDDMPARCGFVHLLVLLALAGACGSRESHPPFDVAEELEEPDSTAGDAGCGPGLAPWPGGACAPAVAECPENWRMPLVGGGCATVGPHAYHVSEGTVDETPGCPAGFVLTDDESACIPWFDDGCGEWEVPLLGGGCRPAGPEAPPGALLSPGPCKPWELPVSAGACLPLGPRVCPTTFDHNAQADCDPGQLLPCREGWQESPDALYCTPIYHECPAGELPVLGGGCKSALGNMASCPAGPFPETPPQAQNVLHVLAASKCAENCGSAQAPYPSIQAAVDDAAAGNHILIGAGDYDEGVLVDKEVHLHGLCPAQTAIAGLVDWGPGGENYAAVGLCILGTAEASVTGIAVSSPGIAVAIIDSQKIILSGLELRSAQDFGLYVSGTQEVLAENLWLHHVISDPVPGLFGCAIEVHGPSNLTAAQCLIEGGKGQGICVHGEEPSLLMTDSTVRQVAAMDSGTGGIGVLAYDGAAAVLERSVVEGCGREGIFVGKEAGAIMRESVVRHGQPGNLPGQGRGISVENGGKLELLDSLLDANRQAAISVLDPGSKAVLSGTVLRGTLPEGDLGLGVGLEAVFASDVTVTRCVIEGSVGRGITLGESGRLQLVGSVIRETLSIDSDMAMGGVFVTTGAQISAVHSLFVDNQGIGVIVAHAGTQAALLDSAITDTFPSPGADSGFGAAALYAGRIQASRVLLDRNTDGGVVVDSTGAVVEVEQSVLRGTRGLTGKAAPGLLVFAGNAQLRDSLVADNQMVGVGLLGQSAVLVMSGTTVRNTALDDDGELGCGMEIRGGARAEVDSSLIAASIGVAISASGAGTEVNMQRSSVSGAAANDKGEWGFGLEASGAAIMQVSLSLVEGHAATGFAVFEPNTLLRLEGITVRGELDEQHATTVGGQVAWGASLEMRASLVAHHGYAGILVFDKPSKASVETSIILDSGLLTEDSRGLALVAMGGGEASVTECLLDGNMTAGIMGQGSGTAVSVERSAIIGTRGGGASVRTAGRRDFAVFGDAVLSADSATVDLTDCYLSRNARCGVLQWNGNGELSGNVIEGNMSYGVALQGGVAPVEQLEADNWIFGNAIELPPDLNEQIAVDPGGLPAPPPPDISLPR